VQLGIFRGKYYWSDCSVVYIIVKYLAHIQDKPPLVYMNKEIFWASNFTRLDVQVFFNTAVFSS